MDPFELWYKPPEREEHQKLNVVLDEIFNRLDKIEHLLEKLNGSNVHEARGDADRPYEQEDISG